MTPRDNAAVVPGTLYLVSTPIGNMGDFSFRAVETLKHVNVVLAEDTRHTRHLLDRYAIATPLASYHEHNEARTAPALVERMSQGESMALVSDAGTPLVSDPGGRLVKAAIEHGLSVVPVPGASAALSALVASGLNTEQFTFLGFLARSGRERREALDAIAGARHTVILYETAPRLARTLTDLEGLGLGDRAGAVAREMTKQFEEIRRGTLSVLRTYYENSPPRGELVLVIAAAPSVATATDEQVRERVRGFRAAGMSARDAAASAARELGVPRRVAYRFAQEKQ